MKKETIKRIDSLFGSIACGLLTVHRRVSDALSFRARKAPVAPRRIVFLKLIEQGATVLAAPAIRRAVELVGRENVFFCVFKQNRPIVDILDLIPRENVLELRDSNLFVFAGDALRVLWRIRRARIDTVVDMEFMARAPAILAYLTGARWRVGLHRFTAEGPYRGDLMTHRVQYNPYLHTSIAYSLLVDALALDPADLPLAKVAVPAEAPRHRFVPTAEEAERVRALVTSRAGHAPRRIVVLNPNTGDLLPIRMWPADRFVALGQRILQEHPEATLVITGAPSEQAGAEEVCRRIGGDRVVSVAGATTLRDVLVLYALADVLVTNDSGPGHFASMTDIHNIVLFGPETPKLFGPLGENRHVVWAELACSPCVNPYNHRFSPCTNNVCMQAITVDRVYGEVRAALAARSAAAPGERRAMT